MKYSEEGEKKEKKKKKDLDCYGSLLAKDALNIPW